MPPIQNQTVQCRFNAYQQRVLLVYLLLSANWLEREIWVHPFCCNACTKGEFFLMYPTRCSPLDALFTFFRYESDTFFHKIETSLTRNIYCLNSVALYIDLHCSNANKICYHDYSTWIQVYSPVFPTGTSMYANSSFLQEVI